VLLVVFIGVFGHGHTVVDGARVDLSRFYVPGLLAMSIVVASSANLVISITSLRETGVLKRRRATPVSPALLVAGQALATVVVALVRGTLLLVIARLLYGVDAAQPIVQGTMLPLWLISGVFIPTANLSRTLRSIGSLFLPGGPVAGWRLGLETGRVEAQRQEPFRGSD
jgi:ABC-2 type transport system permease protein